MIENRRELVDFLVEAKQKTYAAGENFVEPQTAGSHELSFATGDFEYRDVYYGGTSFLGQETVRFAGQVVLGMNYYGHMLASTPPAGFGECLKEALRKVPSFAPYRGPHYYRCGAIEYSCSWTGDLEAFHGTERISSGGVDVYELHFHGGVIT